ncbi:hypothetical protein [Gordonia sp. 852002-51296_SCH5728562-b]|uniref:hypothetical protein n=1 Tax=Gordonia sp. 852002-51296_SCH5728562-b TaxID=1834101 RepID=UPI0007EBAB40|nr:hypothetical protein [Gordonia sp. 852002-51296_SCH5728562-b]OBA32882.1 hypothetical protein A5766_12515 [Gordonia sp. 852002-51296_SCH5728562-b]
MFDQTTKRERRRRWLTTVYDADFDFAAEVDAIVGPLAQRVAAQPRPIVFGAHVEAVTEAVGGLCGTVAELVADTRLRSLDSVDRARAREALRTVNTSAVLTISPEALADGTWAAALVEIARPHTEALSRLLGRQNDARRGEPTASDLLIDALRGLDSASLDLSRRVDKAEYWRSITPDADGTTGPDAAQSARDTLAELGIGAST